MMRLVRPMLALLGLGCAAAVLAHFTGAPASAAAPTPVQVTNTPLPVQGTVNARAVILNTVPVTGSVSLAGNSSATPAYVDVDRSARNGFGATCYIQQVDSTTGQATCPLLTLSPGQEVVIETVTCSALIATGNVPDLELIMDAPALGGGGTVSLDHFLPLARAGGDSVIEFWRFASPLRVYATAPASGSADISAFLSVTPSGSVRQNATCSIAGYVVN